MNTRSAARTPWYRWTTSAMLALAFLIITAATEHASSPPAAGHIPLTRNEIAALFSTLITEPVTDARHACDGQPGGDAASTAPEAATTSDKPVNHEGHEVRQEY
jgi:hypothetical protein